MLSSKLPAKPYRMRSEVLLEIQLVERRVAAVVKVGDRLDVVDAAGFAVVAVAEFEAEFLHACIIARAKADASGGGDGEDLAIVVDGGVAAGTGDREGRYVGGGLLDAQIDGATDRVAVLVGGEGLVDGNEPTNQQKWCRGSPDGPAGRAPER